ncbi:MAG: DUF4264 domain-containing protein [Firmicutes bacterium HGW-Firmicutes-14]|nr:MAG: DUF4264 domain-containing protein [Firmicutes bacterium HGW-Firmicutes-14]
MEEQTKGKLELVATKSFKPYDDMYKIVDYLNKSLKHKNLMFGLTKNDDGFMTITIYEV